MSCNHHTPPVYFLASLALSTVLLLLLSVFPVVHTMADRFTSVKHASEQINTSNPETSSEATLLPADSLMAESTFLAARLQNNEKNKIALSLDLNRQVLSIEIEGVPVRTCEIKRFKLSKAADRACWTIKDQSGPFILQQTYGSIPRIPVQVIDAPRDSVEAMSRPPLDFPTDKRDTYFTLTFDQGVSITVVQPPSKTAEWLPRSTFFTLEKVRSAWKAAGKVANGELPDQTRNIWIELSPEDAKAVYRAVPDSARMALRLPV